MTTKQREALRRSFLPARVRVLFIGESPPAGGSFFYSADSELFRSTRDAFRAALGAQNGPFLDRFAALGCYLEDLCREPVNRLTHDVAGNAAKRRAAHRAGEGELAKTLAIHKPQVIVVLMKSIAPSVARAAHAADCAHVESHVLTYPSRWHRHRLAYREQLTALVRDLARRGLITPCRE